MNTSFDKPPRAEALRAVTVIGPDQGENLNVLGHRLQLKLSSADTGGALSLWFETVPPGGGPPPHVHHSEDEIFLVLDGEITFWSEAGTTRAGPGHIAYGPRGVAHTFKNTGARDARMVVLATPGGFEEFFRAVAQPADGTGPTFPPSPQTISRALAAGPQHGLTFVCSTAASR